MKVWWNDWKVQSAEAVVMILILTASALCSFITCVCVSLHSLLHVTQSPVCFQNGCCMKYNPGVNAHRLDL